MSASTLSPCSCALPEPQCIDSRQQTEYRRRRYRCNRCDYRWTTVEIIVSKGMGNGRAGRGSAREAAMLKFSADECRKFKQIRGKLLALADEVWSEP